MWILQHKKAHMLQSVLYKNKILCHYSVVKMLRHCAWWVYLGMVDKGKYYYYDAYAIYTNGSWDWVGSHNGVQWYKTLADTAYRLTGSVQTTRPRYIAS